MPLFLLIIPVLSTLAGGLLALRFRGARPVLLALGAGLLLGAAFLDLLPEALGIGAGVGLPAASVLGLTLGFFLLFSALESGLDYLGKGRMGRVGGGLMIFHSLRDGMAIGAAFAASHAAGYAVAMGVAAHDLGDGMNTVILTTGGRRARREDYLFLLADALAPFVGGMVTIWWMVSSWNAVVLLALTAGFFLQMATSDLLPQVRGAEGGGRLLVGVVAGGAAVIWGANLLLRGW